MTFPEPTLGNVLGAFPRNLFVDLYAEHSRTFFSILSNRDQHISNPSHWINHIHPFVFLRKQREKHVRYRLAGEILPESLFMQDHFLLRHAVSSSAKIRIYS